MNEPKDLLDVYELYAGHVKATQASKKAKNLLNETQSAFMRFLLVGLGYQRKPKGRKMTNSDVQAARDFMKTQMVSQLLKSREAIQEGFEKLEASKSSRNTYKGRLEQLLAWGEQQFWWPEQQSSGSKRRKYCPRMQKGNGRINNSPLTERRSKHSAYQLQPQEISSTLEAQLKEFYEFLTQPEWPGRLSKPISVSSAETYLKQIRLMLGWFHRYENIPLDQMSVNRLIPKITDKELEDLSEARKQELWSEKKLAVDTWIGKHFQFLREIMNSLSPSTKKFKVNALSALVKFIYYEEVVQVSDYANIPVFKAVNKHSRLVRKEIKQWKRDKQHVVSPDKKWPDVIDGKTALTTVRLQILEPLRLECRRKYDSWHVREGSAIAKSFQRYLVWSFLADIPARRQEEYRSLRVSLCCPLKRPGDVPPNGLYNPLPPKEVRRRHHDGSLADNYLHKTYACKNSTYPDGVWVLDVQEYKTSNTYGSQSIAIPNRRFSGGMCLYDHIERYLYGWWMQGVGENPFVYGWWHQKLKGQSGQWLTAGRAEFSPGDACYIGNQEQHGLWSWGYFFLKPQVGLPYNSSEFKGLVANAAHRLTEKRLTPHVLRYVWATWAYQVGLSDHQRESLAYAMGHDVKTMREMYEQCTPDEKRRPIEEAIDALLFSTPQPLSQVADSTDELEQLVLELQKLPPAELQQMKQLLSANPSTTES